MGQTATDTQVQEREAIEKHNVLLKREALKVKIEARRQAYFAERRQSALTRLGHDFANDMVALVTDPGEEKVPAPEREPVVPAPVRTPKTAIKHELKTVDKKSAFKLVKKNQGR